MKKYIVGFVAGVVIASTVTTAALTLSSKDVSYDNTNSGADSSNVQGAVDELYEMINSNSVDLLWTNSNPTSSFAAQTISLDLTNYEMIIIQFDAPTSSSASSIPQLNRTVQFVEKNISTTVSVLGGYSPSGGGAVAATRSLSTSNSGVTLGNATYYVTTNTIGTRNEMGVPQKIWGVKKALDIYKKQ